MFLIMTDESIKKVKDEPLRRVLAIIKPAALARKLKLSKQATSQWLRVPPLRAKEVASITGISEYILRPDVFKKDGDASPQLHTKPRKRRGSQRNLR